MMTEMRIITKRLEDTPFDRLRASAHGEPVEPRDLRVSSRLREKPCRCDRRTYAACATDELPGCLLGLRPGPLRCTPPRRGARRGPRAVAGPKIALEGSLSLAARTPSADMVH